jgi:hypothetical protein
MTNEMPSKFDRIVIFITGTNNCGKTRLGHMLATLDECLYSYLTLSPQKYFSEVDGLLLEPKEKVLSKLREDILSTSLMLAGGISSHDGRQWLRGDKLIGYDYKTFANKLCSVIGECINVGKFYFFYDKYLQETRDAGDLSKFTVFEVEGIEGTNYVRFINNTVSSSRFISVIRKNPIDQLRSLKVNLLVRGPNNREYQGALSSISNLYYTYIDEMLEQYSWAIKGNDSLVKSVIFEDLINLNENGSMNLSEIVFGKKTPRFAQHLMRMSTPSSHITNQFLSLHRTAMSFYERNRQKHLSVELRKDNFETYTFRFEKYFYDIINELGCVNEQKRGIMVAFKILRDIIFYPVLLIYSFVFGFKEVRNSLSVLTKIRLRKNSFMIVYKLGIKTIYLRTMQTLSSNRLI